MYGTSQVTLSRQIKFAINVISALTLVLDFPVWSE